MSFFLKEKNKIINRFREDNPLIQVLLGPRQIGKSTLAKQIFDEWDGPKIMITADSPVPPSPSWIELHWQRSRQLGEGVLLIIDEIQKVPQWSEQVKLLFDEDRGRRDLKVLLLGSSSLYLQKGLSESLAGRFELISLSHWSYYQFHQAFGWDFETYFQFGSYPGTTRFASDPERWRSYILNSIIEPVLGKDILLLHPIKNPALFRQTFELIVQYPSFEISYQKLLGQLQDRGNVSTIKHYLDLLEKSFLIKTLQKYTGSTLKTKSSSPKIVVLNLALTHAFQDQSRLQNDPNWYGHMFESLVGAHLAKIPNSQLYYWREGKYEVDYILKTPQKLFAIEIKSGRKKTNTGLSVFQKKYPKADCQIWDFETCLKFMKLEIPSL
jgi:hypothetical protein